MAVDGIPSHVDPALVLDFDYRYASGIERDPWAYFGSFADAPELFWSPALGGYWVPATADLIGEIFMDVERFSNGVVSIPAPPRPQSIPASLDPPEHTKYRKIISQRMFTPRALAGLVDHAGTITDELVDRVLPLGRCEFVADIARPLPVGLILRMLGMPDDVRADLTRWVRMIFHGRSVDEHLEGYRAAFGYLGEWLRDAIARRPGEGMVVPAFLEAQVDGRPLTFEEMHSMSMLLIGAGVDTATSQLTHAMRYFAEHREARARIAAEPAVIPAAIEELLRRYGISNITRVVRHDMTYRGVAMKAGDLVMLASAVAGLDPRRFPDPLRVDFDRPGVKGVHRPFGAGPHICPGAYLARELLRTLMTRIVPRLEGVRVERDADLPHASGITVSLQALPLAWG
jgi:cytochrome P450